MPNAAADRSRFGEGLPPTQRSNLALAIFLLVLAALPVKMLYDSYVPGFGFLHTIHFSHRLSHYLDPEIREITREVAGPVGYDGQFYAVMAMCPDLQCEGMGYRSDAPGYRFRRIGLPALAWMLGLGMPLWALHVYAVIDLFFWIGLLLLIQRYTGFHGIRDKILAISLLWSAGTLISLERALTDLPAVVLTSWVASGLLRRSWGGVGMAMALLVKETSLLSMPALLRGNDGVEMVRDRKNWIRGGLTLLPLVLWLGWVNALFPEGSAAGRNNFGAPFAGLWGSVVNAWTWEGRSLMHERIHLLLTLTALASLLVQSAYLLWRPRIDDAFWRMGVAFGVLLLFLGSNVMLDYNAYLRVVLPLTFSFNFLLHRHERGKVYLLLQVAGNLGMMGVAFNEFLGFLGHAIV